VVPPTPPAITTAPLPSPPASGSAGPAAGSPANSGLSAGSAAQGGALSAGGMPTMSLQGSDLLQLLGLLGTPPNVGVEDPNLEHFGNVSSGTANLAAALSPSTPAGGGPHLPPALWLAVLALIAVAALRMLARRAGRTRFARGAEIAAVPLLLVILFGAVAAAPKNATMLTSHRFLGAVRPAAPQAAKSAPVAQAAQASALAAGPAVTVSNKAPTPGEALLGDLLSLESTVAADEAQIQGLTVPAASQPLAAPRMTTLHGSAQRGYTDSTDPATAAHDVAASLEATLQQEYSLFLGAARAPAQAAGLVEASASKPAAVREAVSYNVQVVEARLAGPITQPFGPSGLAFEPALTFGGVTYPHFHTGIDIAGPLDAPIHAAADGVVAVAGAETDSQGHRVGYGNYVVVAHPARMITLYGHLDQILVHVGQVVHAGDVLGLEGSSGNSTGPHLHFEVHDAGLLTDPAKYLVGGIKAL
jgi:murein DD-endopeptidase MepM/ murein hydrolase activator NlpD